MKMMFKKMLDKTLATNDGANPKIIIPLTIFVFFAGLVFTGVAIFFGIIGGHQQVQVATSAVAGISWLSLVLIAHKYNGVAM